MHRGKFDLVLCLGVLYHLPDPYRGMVILADACATGGRLFVETVAVDDRGIDFPIRRFYPARSLKGTLGNFWGQSPSCLEAMLIDVGFSIHRTHLLPFNEEGNARMMVEAVRVENPELEHRKKIAYNLRAGA